jgi:hypothetical protein
MSKEIDVYVNQQESSTGFQPSPETLQLILQLAVGGVMEGADELARRLQERQHELNQNRAGKITVFAGDESDAERLRYALLGILFETPGVVARQLSAARQNTQRVAGMVAKVTRPLTNSWLARPARRRYQNLVARRNALIDRLIEVGRTEEQSGRLLARDVTVETLDELLTYLAQKPEIRQIVQEQGLSLTGEVVNEMRKRTAAADSLVDRLLGRRTPDPPPAIVPGSSTAAKPVPQNWKGTGHG